MKFRSNWVINDQVKTLTLIIFSFFCFVDVRKELPVINMNENKRNIA